MNILVTKKESRYLDVARRGNGNGSIAVHFPSTNNSQAKVKFLPVDDSDGEFYIGNAGDERFLYFYKGQSGTHNQNFDAVAAHNQNDNCKFLLYRPSSEAENTEIPDYAKVPSADELQNGYSDHMVSDKPISDSPLTAKVFALTNAHDFVDAGTEGTIR